jgi:amino acid transporter
MFVSIGAAADALRPRPHDAERVTRRRILLLGVAALLSLSALLAIAILLVGSFGRTEQRILGTTMLLAGYGVLGLPSVMLFDRGRQRRLATAAALAPAVAAALSLAGVWGASDSDTFGKSVGTAVVVALALAQTAAVSARRRDDDPPLVRRLFAGSCALAAVGAATATALLWAGPSDPVYTRLFGALVVLDLLLVALQPVLARARPLQEEHRFRIVLATGETVEVVLAGDDVATAAARAIRTAQRGGSQVVRLDVRDEEALTAATGGARAPRAAARARRAG